MRMGSSTPTRQSRGAGRPKRHGLSWTNVGDRSMVGRRVPSDSASSSCRLGRLLLRNDGSTMTLLEAIVGSSIVMHVRTCITRPAGSIAARLGMDPRETVLHREVEMLASGTEVAVAWSDIAIGRLPTELRTQLRATCIPLGVLLRQYRIETHREAAVLEEPAVLGTTTPLCRRYRIFVGAAPLCEIVETFATATLEELWNLGK